MATGRLKIMFDENFSSKHVDFVARESRLAELQHVKARGWSSMPDTELYARATEQGFVIVTWDRNEKTRGFTLADLKSMGSRVMLIGAFFDHLGRWDKAKWFVAHAETIVTECGDLSAGSVKLMAKNGKTRTL